MKLTSGVRTRGRGVLAVIAALGVLALATPVTAQVAYVAATWSDNAVHLLDAGLNDIGSFPAGAANPNGITTDGVLIYTGHFGTQEVVAYDLFGVEQFRWSGALSGLQGMTMAGTELAVANASSIEFYDPATGTLLRSVPSPEPGGAVEGLTFDGASIWALGNTGIYRIDPADGSVLATLANPVACSFGGTGITMGGPGELVLVCTNGTWYRVSSANGSILASGNNGLDMYGVEAVRQAAEAIPVLGPAGTLTLALLVAAAGAALAARLRT